MRDSEAINQPHKRKSTLQSQFINAGFLDATFDTVAVHAIREDLAVWRWVVRGTNTGSYRGLPLTGRSLILPGCEFIEVRQGLLQRVEGYFDRLGILQQLGLMPVPGQASS